jgi:two-component system NtrC family sensor kinase
MPRKLANLILGVLTLVAVAGAFSSFQRMRSSFERLDFQFHWINGIIHVDLVDSGSEAQRAGLRGGDQIIVVGGVPSNEVDGLKQTLRRAGRVQMVISRGGELRTVDYSPPPLKIDYRYLFLTFIGFLYLAIGIFTLTRGAGGETLLFYLVTLLAFVVYVYSPAGRLDSTFKALWMVEEFARIFLPPLTLHFFLRFPRPLFRNRLLVAAIYAAPLLMALWVINLLMLRNIVEIASPSVSFLIIDRWQMLHFAAYFTLAFVALTYTYRTAPAIGHKRQIQWIYLGMAAGFIPFLILYLIPFIMKGAGSAYTTAAILPLALIPLAFAVSILRYKLWDVEVVIKEVLAYTVTFIFGMIGFSTVNVILSRALEEQLTMERNFLAFASGLLIAGVLVPVKGKIESLLEMVLYRDTYRHRKAMLDVASELASFHDLHDLLAVVRERLAAATKVTKLNLYLRDGQSLHLFEQEAGTPTQISESDLPGLAFGRALVLDRPRLPDPSDVSEGLLRSGYRTIFPLRHRGELQGLLACGNRRGEIPLSRDDLQLIGSLTAPLSLAIENARLYGRLRKQLDEIRTLKEYNEHIIESSPSAIVVVAGDGTLLTANQAFWDMTSLDPSTEKRVTELFPVYEQLRESPGAVAELEYVNPKGETKTLSLTASRFNAPDVPPDASILVIADISERAELQRELQEKERLASLGLLAAGVAHEVNTPLTGISSYAQLLLSDTSPDDPRFRILKKMEQQTFRASHLVNNLLNFAANRQHNLEPVNLGEVVQTALAMSEDMMRNKSIGVHFDLDTNVIVRGSFYELQQVVTNLLLNAKDAVPDRGNIWINVKTNGSTATLEVRDDGRGIPLEVIGRIFKPLVTTKRNTGGTGLGLAIAERIVQAHGGNIRVESKPEQGATFLITLPLLVGTERT